MPAWIHFDASHLITAGVTLALSAGAYYVKSQIKIASLTGNARRLTLTEKMDQIATGVMSKLDDVREEIARVNVTLARSEERLAHTQEQLAKHEAKIERNTERIAWLERRVSE